MGLFPGNGCTFTGVAGGGRRRGGSISGSGIYQEMGRLLQARRELVAHFVLVCWL